MVLEGFIHSQTLPPPAELAPPKSGHSSKFCLAFGFTMQKMHAKWLYLPARNLSKFKVLISHNKAPCNRVNSSHFQSQPTQPTTTPQRPTGIQPGGPHTPDNFLALEWPDYSWKTLYVHTYRYRDEERNNNGIICHLALSFLNHVINRVLWPHGKEMKDM